MATLGVAVGYIVGGFFLQLSEEFLSKNTATYVSNTLSTTYRYN